MDGARGPTGTAGADGSPTRLIRTIICKGFVPAHWVYVAQEFNEPLVEAFATITDGQGASASVYYAAAQAEYMTGPVDLWHEDEQWTCYLDRTTFMGGVRHSGLDFQSPQTVPIYPEDCTSKEFGP